MRSRPLCDPAPAPCRRYQAYGFPRLSYEYIASACRRLHPKSPATRDVAHLRPRRFDVRDRGGKRRRRVDGIHGATTGSRGNAPRPATIRCGDALIEEKGMSRSRVKELSTGIRPEGFVRRQQRPCVSLRPARAPRRGVCVDYFVYRVGLNAGHAGRPRAGPRRSCSLPGSARTRLHSTPACGEVGLARCSCSIRTRNAGHDGRISRPDSRIPFMSCPPMRTDDGAAHAGDPHDLQAPHPKREKVSCASRFIPKPTSR